MAWMLGDFRTAVQARIGTAATVDQEIADAVDFLSRRIQLEIEEASGSTVTASMTSINRPQDSAKVECVYIPADNLEIYEISLAGKRAQQDSGGKIYFWLSHDLINFTDDLSKYATPGSAIWTRYLQYPTQPDVAVEYNGADATKQVIVSIAAYFYMLRAVGEYIATPNANMTLSEMQSAARLFGEAMDEQLAGVEMWWRSRRYAGRPEPLPSGRSDS